MRVGLIGFGYWGPNFARVISESGNSELVAICDSKPSRSKEAKSRYGKCLITKNVDELLSGDLCDTIVICTPVSTHYELVSKSIKAGKNVLCEKPLSASSAEVIQLSNLAKKHKITLMVGQVFEYNSVIQTIKSSIRKNELGKLFYMSFTRTGLGPVRSDVNVAFDLASHDISIALYLTGEMPEYVSAVGSSFLKENREDIAFINLVFPGNMIANISVSWIDPMKQREVKIVGSKKTMLFNDTSVLEKLKIITTGKDYQTLSGDFASFQLSVKDGNITIPNVSYPEPLKTQWDHFIYCVKNKKLPQTDATNALRVAKVLEAVQKSISSNGKNVKVNA